MSSNLGDVIIRYVQAELKAEMTPLHTLIAVLAFEVARLREEVEQHRRRRPVVVFRREDETEQTI